MNEKRIVHVRPAGIVGNDQWDVVLETHINRLDKDDAVEAGKNIAQALGASLIVAWPGTKQTFSEGRHWAAPVPDNLEDGLL